MEASKLRVGSNIMFDGSPFKVVKYMLRPQSRGSAKMVTKMKNLLTGSTIEKTFPSCENLDDADIEMGKAQFLYSTGTDYTFMDNESFEQFEFSGEKLGKQKDFLVDGMDVGIMKWNGNAINVELPVSVEVKVVYAEPGVKGDTASSANKNAEIESGATIHVPLFIDSGERILINTQTGEYMGRAK